MNEGEDATSFGGSFSTGHAGVDEAMAEIAALGDADLATHAQTFERAHDALRTALTAPAAEADEGAAPPAAEA
ncbi:MAG: hypothetical protein ACTHJM_01675 [Marmoricola sp.]